MRGPGTPHGARRFSIATPFSVRVVDPPVSGTTAPKKEMKPKARSADHRSFADAGSAQDVAVRVVRDFFHMAWTGMAWAGMAWAGMA
jgi:hypothetical protein